MPASAITTTCTPSGGPSMPSFRLKLKNECLVEAFTARRFAQRKYPTTVYMGVAKKDGGLAAHAWTRCGTCIVTGAEGRDVPPVTATFA